MEITSEETIGYPMEQVWLVMRDHLPELAQFLSGAESIEVEEREELGPGRLRLLNIWQGSGEKVPKAIRPFLSKNIMRLKDHAIWDESRKQVSWRFETFHFNKLFDCAGETRFSSTSNQHTRIVIRGELKIYPDRVPGVPRFLAKKIGPTIERFVVDLVGSNMREISGSIQKFLDRRQGVCSPEKNV